MYEFPREDRTIPGSLSLGRKREPGDRWEVILREKPALPDQALHVACGVVNGVRFVFRHARS
ncbi:hypothetical protein CH379_007290 [Leptospira ellisii]|uniref:Uncharacterized protein n=1 Tax=Leptospira ellisii TaxID=2023197 RepID=A0AAE4TY60_9LEPT|nr:hypothetical protein [Leptospira ellisii]MDV6235430.1 hypothetical protein [Leptospira ellisii]